MSSIIVYDKMGKFPGTFKGKEEKEAGKYLGDLIADELVKIIKTNIQDITLEIDLKKIPGLNASFMDEAFTKLINILEELLSSEIDSYSQRLSDIIVVVADNEKMEERVEQRIQQGVDNHLRSRQKNNLELEFA